jgi:hypothetical protein
MKERMTNILNLVKANTAARVEEGKQQGMVVPGITDFEIADEDTFTLKTRYSDFGQLTQLKFETSAGGALIWITIMHMFGYQHN